MKIELENQTASFEALLLAAARPDLYRRNAFRVLNLPVRSTERDVQKHLRQMRLQQNFGNKTEAVPANAVRPLPLSPPPDAEMLAEAQSRLSQMEQRLLDEFFWFWTTQAHHAAVAASTADDVAQHDEALAALTRADVEAAARVLTRRAAQADAQGVAAHDLAVMFHAAALDFEWAGARDIPLTGEMERLRDAYWQNAIVGWRGVHADKRVWESIAARVDELSDPRLTKAMIHQLRSQLPLFLLGINAQLAVQASQRKAGDEVNRQLRLMEDFGFEASVVEKAREAAIAPVRRRVHDLCRTLEQEARNAPDTAVKAAERMLERARPLLFAVDDLLPANDPQRNDVLDAVAFAVNETAIIKHYGRPSVETREWEATRQLLERTSRYAASTVLRGRINETLTWIRTHLPQTNTAQPSAASQSSNASQPGVGAQHANPAPKAPRPLCWFCGRRVSEPAAAAPVRLYSNDKRYYTDLEVPRCASCKAPHDRAEESATRGGVLGALLALVVCISLLMIFGKDAISFISIIVALVMGVTLCWAGDVIGRDREWSKLTVEIKPLQDKWNHPEVAKLLSSGWSTRQN